MNVIIVAAIALLVLVVLVAIFSGRMGSFNRDLDDQTNDQECTGTIRDASLGCEDTEYQALGKFKDITAGKICCVERNE